MNSKIKSVELPLNSLSDLPNGTYNGVWGGYEVVIRVGNVSYKLYTEQGIKCVNCPCTIAIFNGTGTVNG